MALSAGELGRRMLGEVEACGFGEILQSLKRTRPGATAHVFGVPCLDRLVAIFQQPPPAIQEAPVVEVGTSRPSEGGSALVYYAVAAAVLPVYPPPGCVAGKGGAAVLVDADGRFDVERLVRVMQSYLLPTSGREKADELMQESEQVIGNALRHVHVLQPQSMAALTASLQGLADYLLEPGTQSGHSSHGKTLSLLAIDSISAFSWQDRAADEALRFDQSSGQQRDANNAPTAGAATHREWAMLVAAVRQLRTQFHVPVLATSWGLIPNPSRTGSGQGVGSYRPHVPGGWAGLVTARLVLEREAVRQFAAGMSLSKAESEQAMRAEVVSKGRWRVAVDMLDAGEWNDRVLQALRETGRGFDMWMSADGVVLGSGDDG